MIGINDKFLDFKNIKEIKFTKVGENTYSISIQSDIEMDDKTLKDSLFESQLCTLDSTIGLHLHNNYTTAWIGEKAINSQCLSVPVNINILLDPKEERFFTISTKK